MDVVQASDRGGREGFHLVFSQSPEDGQTDGRMGERMDVLLHACDEETLSHSLF